MNAEPIVLLLSHTHGELSELTLQRRVLHGGLEAAGVEHIQARFLDARGRRRVFSVVAKRLVGRGLREHAVYRDVLGTRAASFAPRLLGSDCVGPQCTTLYLEPVRSMSAWPWRDVTLSQQVLERVAGLHRAARKDPPRLPAWDYEAELSAAGFEALEHLERCRRDPVLRALARALPSTKRLVHALPELRRELLWSSLGTSLVHGDLHSGNVIVRRRATGAEPVFIDWGRARSGSPLEDVSSWLQSLGYWEPEARRRHDTLFRGYLRALGRPDRLTAELREAYWLAGASNAFAGSLSYHLQRAQHAVSKPEREHGMRAAYDALRVLRRAHAIWN
jgi:hypothetical protein